MYFHSSLCHTLHQPATEFQMNPSIFVESRANTKWMCIIFMLKQPTGGHCEFSVLAKLHPYGMYSNLATCSLNIKTIGLNLWSPWWWRGKYRCNVYIKNQPKTTSWWQFWVSDFSRKFIHMACPYTQYESLVAILNSSHLYQPLYQIIKESVNL